MSRGKYQPIPPGIGEGTTSPQSSSKRSSWPCTWLCCCLPRCCRLNSFGMGALVMFAVLFSVWMLAGDRLPRPERFPMAEATVEGACDAFHSLLSPGARPPDIPNLVHYVWLSVDPSRFAMGFQAFLSVYSSDLFLSPDVIYIHTDATPEALEQARHATLENGGDVWTQRLLSIPSVHINHIVAPDVSDSGVPIAHMAHKSDFVRMGALKQFGGIYLDTDVIPLRDMRSLRQTGYAAVIGGDSSDQMRFSGRYGNGIMLARQDSLLLHLWSQAMHRYFDGEWATASIYLLSDLADRLLPLEGEVLALHPKAFTPTSWELQSQWILYRPSLSSLPPDFVNEAMSGLATPKLSPDNSRCQAAADWIVRSEASRFSDPDSWERDFAGSYTVHAFDSHTNHIYGWEGEVTLEYILERKSNYARAIYPAVKHAIDGGIIPQQNSS